MCFAPTASISSKCRPPRSAALPIPLAARGHERRPSRGTWARAGANGRAAVVVLNASLDPQPELALRLRMPPGEVEHVPMEGKTAWLETEPTPEPGYRRVAVPEVAPWSMHLLLFEQPPTPE